MALILLFVFLLILGCFVFSLRIDVQDVQHEVWSLRNRPDFNLQDDPEWRLLLQRVETCERKLRTGGGYQPNPPKEKPHEAPVAEPTPAAPDAVTEPVVVSAPIPLRVASVVPVAPPPPPPPITVVAAPEPKAAATPAPEPVPAPQHWEAVLGSNWLNKLGVIILVIGLALFTGYSLSHMQAAGRIAVGLGIGAMMLAGGLFAERREAYRLFGSGLIAGGWATLYFTTFATHGIAAARIIDNPLLASELLVLVAGGMILHSLRYRSAAMTGLAYFIGFLTLALSQVSVFAIGALLPLAASLLYLASRFRWTKLAWCSVPATYCLFLYQASQMPAGSVWRGQAMLLVYWALYEAFDLIDARHPENEGEDYGPVLTALNAVFFLGISGVIWMVRSPEVLYQFLFTASVVYLLSTLARITWLSPQLSTDPTPVPFSKRSYHGAFSIHTVALFGGLIQYFSGTNLIWALLAHGEALFLTGLVTGSALPGQLALPILGVAFGNIVQLIQVHTTTPAAVAAAAIFSFNRWIRGQRLIYGGAALLLIGLVAWMESPIQYVGLVYAAISLALFEVGIRYRARDYEWQGIALLIMSVFAFVFQITGQMLPPGVALAGVLVLGSYSARTNLLRRTVEEAGLEALFAGIAHFFAGGLALWFCWRVMPGDLLPLAWSAVGWFCLEAGQFANLPLLAYQGHGILLGAATLALGHRLPVLIPISGFHYFLAYRLRNSDGRPGAMSRVYLYAAGLLVTRGLIVSERWVPLPVGGAVVALIWQQTAQFTKLRDLHRQALVLAVAAYLWSMLVQADVRDSVVVIAALMPAGLTTGKDDRTRHVFSLLANVRLATLLFDQVSGGLLTVAWGLQGTTLLACGFPLKDRAIRYTGLGLLGCCVGKLFFYDLQALETPYRIASFVILGLLLIAISWVYTRFRERIEQYL